MGIRYMGGYGGRDMGIRDMGVRYMGVGIWG